MAAVLKQANQAVAAVPKSKRGTKKILDWIPAALDHVEKERQKVADIIDDENTAYEEAVVPYERIACQR